MYLKKLSLINFKNIREENLEFRPGINCFVGDNGAGKTNVIDAVYFLSMCKSSLAMTDGQNMRHGSDFFLLDEPVSHLDETNNRIVADIITEEAARTGAAVIATSVGNNLDIAVEEALKL